MLIFGNPRAGTLLMVERPLLGSRPSAPGARLARSGWPRLGQLPGQRLHRETIWPAGRPRKEHFGRGGIGGRGVALRQRDASTQSPYSVGSITTTGVSLDESCARCSWRTGFVARTGGEISRHQRSLNDCIPGSSSHLFAGSRMSFHVRSFRLIRMGEDRQPAPVYRLYSRRHVELATFFGSPIAGALLIRANFRRLGNPRAGRQVVLLAAVGAAAVIAGAVFSVASGMPRRALPLFYELSFLSGVFILFERSMQSLVKAHVSAGGRTGPWRRALGAAAAGLVGDGW